MAIFVVIKEYIMWRFNRFGWLLVPVVKSCCLALIGILFVHISELHAWTNTSGVNLKNATISQHSITNGIGPEGSLEEGYYYGSHSAERYSTLTINAQTYQSCDTYKYNYNGTLYSDRYDPVARKSVCATYPIVDIVPERTSCTTPYEPYSTFILSAGHSIVKTDIGASEWGNAYSWGQSYPELYEAYGVLCGAPSPEFHYTENTEYTSSYTFKLDCQGQMNVKTIEVKGRNYIGTSNLLINGVSLNAGENKWIIPVNRKCGDLVTLTPSVINGYRWVMVDSIVATIESCDLKITSLGGNDTIIPDTGGVINLSGTILETSGKPIIWTLDIAGKTYYGTGNSVNVTWDGKDISGKVVDPGQYSATLTAQTADGKCSDSKPLSFNVVPPPDGQCGLFVDFGSSANVASGNLSHSQELFSTKGTSLATGMTLYYNSLNPHNASLGTGWSHSYDIALKQNSNGSVVIRDGSGKRKLYTLSNGAYVSQPWDSSTLVKNADNTFTHTQKDGTRQNFGTDGKITAIIDRNGNAVSFAYSGGNLTTVTDPAGRVTTLSYDAANHLTAVTDPAGNAYSLAYSGKTLSSVTYPDGGTWRYTYDANAFMLSKTDSQGFTTSYAYDDQQRVVSSTDPEGKVRSVSYPQPGTDATKTTTFTEKDGGVWTYRYDTEAGILTSKTDPQGGVTSYSYDAAGNRTSTTLPDGTTTTSTYDGLGNMTSTTDALGQTTSYTYNGFGQVLSSTDSQGDTTGYSYDAAGNLTAMTDPTGATTKYQYDAKGNVTRVTNPLGQTTSFVYDVRGNLASVTDPAGATTSFTYDAAGNMTSQTDANGATTRFEYNAKNQLLKMTDPEGNATTYTYDVNGNRTSQTDANDNTTRYEYNYKGQLVKTTDALGNITTYAYSGSGCPSCGGGTDKLVSLTDANGNVTSYQYDPLGRLVKETDPLGNATSYSYDARGNLTSKTDGNGNSVTYTYDPLGRLLKKSYPDGTADTFTYDAKGNILTATNTNISYKFSYDAAGRMLATSDSNGQVVQYGYDTAGRKTKTTYPEGSVVSYVYDTAGRLATITNGGGRTYGYTYDRLGRRSKLTYPNGAIASYAYDTASRLANLSHKASNGSTIASFAYTHDKVGNRLTKTEPSVQYTYGYDKLYQLLQSLPTRLHGRGDNREENEHHDHEIRSEQYTYDPVGNRLSGPRQHNTYTYGPENELLTTTNGTYTYDKNGNLISRMQRPEHDGDDDERDGKAWSYTYDYENRLIKAETKHEDETVIVSFKYDPFGRRIEKKVEEIESGKADEGKTYTYVYDGQAIILEYLAKTDDGITKTETTKYVHGPGIDEPLSILRKGEVYYYHADGLGSIMALTDKKQKVVENYEYDSFGNMKRHGDKVKNTFTYTGREWDKETGLYYYRARYYDPMDGRFIQKDPIGINGGINLYAYSLNNPINLTDPLGLRPGDIFQSVELAVTDAIMYVSQRSNAEGVEYGGWITKTNDCKFTYSEPTRGNRRDIPNFPSKPSNAADAWYHTHLPVNWFDEHLAGANPRDFSPADRQLSDRTHSTGYLGYGGNIYIYYPQ